LAAVVIIAPAPMQNGRAPLEGSRAGRERKMD
jgi:hypothetical protein